jgi:hypothetical protein
MRPKLPPEIEQTLPEDIVRHIYSFVPHIRERKPTHSPSLQKELERIQSCNIKGKTETYMKGLDDFCLD